ncbi:hypothetical protein [Larkinella humicola]|uniref:DUF3592 domain-containing protein n=1 Tax=Larkinella humicola TaxID=2607654 RepID=A0A5N1JAS3_9BACT|nr:hypothetical protein [Larkinella humicola]KAA9346403.1 hypothetical protein F0P93_27860 [Larkinella humicola]
MLRELVVFLGKLYRLVVSLMVVALLAAVAWWFWHLYEDERLQNQFLKEGNVVEVQVAGVDATQRSYRDMLGNSRYITFPYRQKSYTIRVVFDTAWVSSGDHIRLLYHPQRDEFRQQQVDRKPGRVESRLVNWSSVRGFSKENKLLLGFLVVVTSLFFFAGGVLVSLTGWTFLQTIARLVLMAVLGIAAVFFTYDTWEYVQYYQHVKTNGKPMDVTVLDTDRHRVGRSTQRSSFAMYDYDAEFNYKAEKWIIPITEAEFETLKPNDKLRVLYDSSLPDFMSATYSGNYAQAIVPAFCWVLFLVVGWNTVFKSSRKQQPG